MPWPLLTLTLLLSLVGVGLYWGLAYPMAWTLLRPPRMSDGKAVHVLGRLSPGDLGIEFEEVRFDVIDRAAGQGIAIAGWWMPQRAGGNRTVVLVHGYGDAKVGAIAWAPLFRAMGCHVLAIDLRGHGESGGDTVTAGYWEREDLGQVLDQAKSRWKQEMEEIFLFGISLGAAVVAAVAGRREDLSGVILESPFADYPTAVEAHADRMGMPGPVLVRRALRVAERLSGANFAEVASARTIREARCRVMVISAAEDPLVGGSRPRLREAVEARGDGSLYWEVEGAYHVECASVDGEGYRRRVKEFLAKESPQTARKNGAP